MAARTADGCSGAFGATDTGGVAFGLAAWVDCFFEVAAGCFFRPTPKGWCLIAWGVAAAELSPCPSMVIPPPINTAASSASRAAYRTVGDSAMVTESLSAAKRSDLKRRGARFPAPFEPHDFVLRAEPGDDVGARAGLVPGLRSDRA